MQRILSEFPWGKVIVYIDDLLIMTETFEEHLSLLSRVLSVLSRHGVKVKPPKCKWLVEEVEYLGHIVSREGLRKPPQYLDKVNEFPMPTTVRQLREFLGLVNFQRKFVANFSSLQKPLSEKLVGRGSRKLKWTRDMEAAFLTLKEKIKEDLLLSFPDFSAGASPLELFVDASDIGAGACLTQQQDGDVRVIAFASMTFNVAERRYSVIEKELAGLRWGVKSFRPFLIGTEFLLYTDHQPLIYLNNMKLIDGRLARTLEDLADYNFRILYLPGKTNCAADALSRLAIGDAIGVGPSTDGSFVFPPHLRCLKLVPGGGDSLADRVYVLVKEHHLDDTLKSSTMLREVLIESILRDPKSSGVELNRQIRKKLRLMKLPGQLLGIEVLYAFARKFHCRVFVHYGSVVPVEWVPPVTFTNPPALRVHLQCIAGVHYNPMVETKGFDESCLGSLGGVAQPMGGDSNYSEDDAYETEVEVGITEVEIWCDKHLCTHETATMVIVGGRRICALIDSGAQVSCISDSIFRELDEIINPNPGFVIRNVGDQLSPVKGSALVDVELGEELIFR